MNRRRRDPARLADSIVVTSDNARTEDPRAIAQAILRGIPPVDRRRVRVELDWARAIRGAIMEARVVDVVVLLGKGAERIQEIGGRRIPFSDERSARRALDARARLGSPTPSRNHPPWAMLSV
jgi:UDP-N-acetylmuramoyl-L-alanyl-D-glutamate--2,6-diaminopimelate ligase